MESSNSHGSHEATCLTVRKSKQFYRIWPKTTLNENGWIDKRSSHAIALGLKNFPNRSNPGSCFSYCWSDVSNCWLTTTLDGVGFQGFPRTAWQTEIIDRPREQSNRTKEQGKQRSTRALRKHFTTRQCSVTSLTHDVTLALLHTVLHTLCNIVHTSSRPSNRQILVSLVQEEGTPAHSRLRFASRNSS